MRMLASIAVAGTLAAFGVGCGGGNSCEKLATKIADCWSSADCSKLTGVSAMACQQYKNAASQGGSGSSGGSGSASCDGANKDMADKALANCKFEAAEMCGASCAAGSQNPGTPPGDTTPPVE